MIESMFVRQIIFGGGVVWFITWMVMLSIRFHRQKLGMIPKDDTVFEVPIAVGGIMLSFMAEVLIMVIGIGLLAGTMVVLHKGIGKFIQKDFKKKFPNSTLPQPHVEKDPFLLQAERELELYLQERQI